MVQRESTDDEVKKGNTFLRERLIIEERLNSEEKGAVVAGVNGAIVGFILFRLVSHSNHHLLYLEYVASDAKFQRRGVASTLINWLINFVKSEFSSLPIKYSYLNVNMLNNAAISLYQRIGFQPRDSCPEQTDFEDPHSMMMRMELDA
jgi:ribosomal protein S18 acetylase RimI-like enzyme